MKKASILYIYMKKFSCPAIMGALKDGEVSTSKPELKISTQKADDVFRFIESKNKSEKASKEIRVVFK